MATTTLSSEHIIKLLFTAAALPARPTTWYAALHTGIPGAAGQDFEVQASNDPNYARQAVSFGSGELAANGFWQAVNDAEVAFPASGAASPYAVEYVVIHDAATGGNALAVLPMEPARTVNVGGQLRFPIGEIIIEGIGYDN